MFSKAGFVQSLPRKIFHEFLGICRAELSAFLGKLRIRRSSKNPQKVRVWRRPEGAGAPGLPFGNLKKAENLGLPEKLMGRMSSWRKGAEIRFIPAETEKPVALRIGFFVDALRGQRQRGAFRAGSDGQFLA